MFTKEGTFPVEIIDAIIAEPKFAEPPAVDICLLVRDESGESDWWRGEVSQNYGRGNFANMTQAQITLKTLAQLGLQNNDLSDIRSLIGTKTTATIKASESNGKTYYNVSYLGGYAPTPIGQDELQRRMQQLFGGQTPVPQPQQQPQQQPPTTNPFQMPTAQTTNPFAA